MPCCTYLSDNEYTQPTSDVELNDLLAEVRQATGDDWRICEIVRERRRWLRAPLVTKEYELFHHVVGPEFQEVNFYRPERLENCFNFVNSAGHVAAYLYGVLAGARDCRPTRQDEE